MKKLPAKIKREVRQIEPQQVDIMPRGLPVSTAFSFSYSSQELHLSDGKTRVKARKIAFENGQIKSESFEGVFPAKVYEQVLGDAQRMFAEQTLSLLNRFSLFLPTSKK